MQEMDRVMDDQENNQIKLRGINFTPNKSSYIVARVSLDMFSSPSLV
jgi:hypothetical protein